MNMAYLNKKIENGYQVELINDEKLIAGKFVNQNIEYQLSSLQSDLG